MKTGVELRGEGGRFERFVLVRELQGRHVPTWLAHAHAPEGVEIVVVERYRAMAAPARDALSEDAKRLVTFRHPNLPAIRDVSRVGPDLLIATEFVEGELMVGLRDLAKEAGKQLPIDVGIRGVVDALAALSALHGMEKTPMVHGDVGPQTVLLGFDGVTRLLRPYRGRVLAVVADASAVQYLAPEQLKTGKGSARADLYPVGVLLWEVLSEKRLFEGVTREGRLARATAPLPKAVVHADAAWAAPLAAVAERALASDPQARYGSAAEMAAAVRLVVRSKLAMPPRVADVVDRYAGAKVLARRVELALPQSPPSGGERRSSVRPPVPAGATKVLHAMRPASRPPTPIPPEAATAPAMVAVPKAPLVPRMGSRPAIAPIELSPPPPSTEAFEFFEEFAPEAITTVVPNQATNGTKPAPAKASAGPPAAAPAFKPLLGAKAAPAVPVAKPAVPAPAAAKAEAAPLPAPVAPEPVPTFVRPNTAPLPFFVGGPEPVPAVPEAAPEAAPEVASFFTPPPPATTSPAPAPSTPSTVPIVTPPPAMRDAALASVPPPPPRTAPNTRRIVAIALILCLLLLAAAGIRKVLSTTAGPVPTGTGTAVATTTATATSTSTSTSTATTTATATATATGTGVEPEPSASASATAVPSGWAAPRPSNSTARPKPTYDPEGI